MSKLIISDLTPDENTEEIIRIYSDLATELEKDLFIEPNVPKKIQSLLKKDYYDNLVWELDVFKNSGVYTITMSSNTGGVSFSRVLNIESGELLHDYFEINSKLQGKGLANKVAAASAKLYDKFSLSSITLAANLDVGGYAWLRRGGVPEGGYSTLPSLIKTGSSELKKRLAGLSETEMQAFVLSNEFRDKWKESFLGSSWSGGFNLDTARSRTAFLTGAESAIKAIPSGFKTSNEKILDSYIRHQTYLLRYAGGLRNQVLPTLAATEKDLQGAILEWVARADGNRTLTGSSGRKWQTDFESVLVGIRKPAWDAMHDEISSQLKELSVSEALSGATVIEGALPVVIGMTLPPADKLIAIVNSQPFEGRTLKQWMQANTQADVQRMLTYSKIGIVQGQTPTQVARGIIGTKQANYTDGIARKAFKDAESVILTLTNGVQNEAKQALYEANSDIVDRELFVNTLDVRTTLICIGAGQANEYGLGIGVYPRGKGPIPPLHFRCRSLRVPYINPENLHMRGFDSSTEKQLLQEYSESANIPKSKKRDSLPRGHKTKFDTFARGRRRELVGQVPATTSYGEWFTTQTKDFQDQVLGPTRADLFRKGEVTLDRFVARDGDVLTLTELRRKGIEVPD